MSGLTDRELLRKLAESATGGDWEYRLGMVRTLPDADGCVPIAVAPNAPKNWRGQRDTNMAFIAECKPSAILALLDELETCKADAERYRWLRDSSESIHQFYLSTPIWFTGVRFSKENVDLTIDAARAVDGNDG